MQPDIHGYDPEMADRCWIISQFHRRSWWSRWSWSVVVYLHLLQDSQRRWIMIQYTKLNSTLIQSFRNTLSPF